MACLISCKWNISQYTFFLNHSEKATGALGQDNHLFCLITILRMEYCWFFFFRKCHSQLKPQSKRTEDCTQQRVCRYFNIHPLLKFQSNIHNFRGKWLFVWLFSTSVIPSQKPMQWDIHLKALLQKQLSAIGTCA